jgi:hypothetical protein
MSRLKHPIRSLREPFGKAGLTVAILALVMALVGGAYAAGGLTKSQEKQVTKIAKKYAGKPGAAGATGPAGTPGTNGANGSPGKNGTNGKNGEEGSPWTAGGTLPKGSTETGTWSISGLYKEGEIATFPISFPIPLPAALGETAVHFVGPGETSPAGCPGSSQDPTAAEGNLCVYQHLDGTELGTGGLQVIPGVTPTLNLSQGVGQGASPTGAWLVGHPHFTTPPTGPEAILAVGAWAVTSAE